jgi:restriction endonuclease Mrr
VPDYQTLMRPVLAYAADGKEKNIGHAIDALLADNGVAKCSGRLA